MLYILSGTFLFLSQYSVLSGTYFRIFEDDFYIFFDMIELFLESLISLTDTLEIQLEEERHRIEEEWHIEDGIPHSEPLPCHCHRHEISESYSSRRDDGKVERIEVALADRISLLEPVDEKGPQYPAQDKNYSYDDESFVVDMEHGR
jgi:hypothetical protein